MRTALSVIILLASVLASGTANAQDGGAPASPASKALNPDVSVGGLFGLSQFNRDEPLVFEGGHDPHFSGINLQQVELTFNSNIDPYFAGQVSLVFVPEDGELKTEIEEAFATTLGLPANLQVKAGQFFTAFGRHNPLHPHAWSFVNKPLVAGRMFGGDGMRNPGAQLSWLTPLPWYSELIVSGQNSAGETMPSFGGEGFEQRSLADLMTLARWVNFFPLGEAVSLNLGGSFAYGPNGTQDATGRTRIAGGDLYLKYRNPGSRSFVALQGEVIKRFYNSAGAKFDDWGMYTEISYLLGEPLERWQVGARYDWVSDRPTPVETSEGDDSSSRWRVSPAITYYPSEFSKLRLQYDHDSPASFGSAQKVVTLQLEFSMGAHLAHVF